MQTRHQPADADNQVFLRGRLAAEPIARALPSGDELWTFRLIVTRPPGARSRVDTLDCSTTRPRTAKTLGRALPGDVLEVTGRLHRRFWRGAAGPSSRYEVEADSVRLSSRRRNAA